MSTHHGRGSTEWRYRTSAPAEIIEVTTSTLAKAAACPTSGSIPAPSATSPRLPRAIAR